MPHTVAIPSFDDLPLAVILMTMLGGLALFLLGLDIMTDSLRRLAGPRMRHLLARLTTNRFTAVLAGAATTAVIQSSSITTVLVVGFVSAGAMTLSQSVGVIMGANIGTTVTAQIIAFEVTQFALLPVIIGFGCQFLARREPLRQTGRLILGLGLIFLGMRFMSEGAEPLRHYQPFVEAMGQMRHPAAAVAAGAAFTALVQSSSATTGVVIVLASQGILPLEAAIGLVLGANVGTCVTAMLASIGKTRDAVRAALIHVIFNLAGAALWLFLIDWLVRVATWLASDISRQIADAHTIFNLANTLLFIGFTGPLARLVQWMVPERPPDAEGAARPRYLDELILQTPDMALDRVRLELERMGEMVAMMLVHARQAVLEGDAPDLQRLSTLDNDVDALHAGIVQYLGRLSMPDLTATQSAELRVGLAAANDLEHIGDTVKNTLRSAGLKRIESAVLLSDATHQRLDLLAQRVTEGVRAALTALMARDRAAARAVLESEAEFSRLASECAEHLVRRLAAPDPDRLVLYRIETDIIEGFGRVHYFARQIARLVIEDHLSPPPPSAPIAPAA